MRTKPNHHILGLVASVVLLLASCANPVAPNGGKKDTDPPKVLSSDPKNKSVNFTGKKIVLDFNEFVALNNPNAQMVISPPLEQFPDIQLRGKSVVLTFKEKLKENATYTINFGESIKDITENNPLKDYTFVFSTGPQLDSLQVKGMVLDAEKSQTVDDILVMLYKDLADSVVSKSKPYYFGHTDKSGRFSINNVKEGTYKIFALKDANFNLLYDLATEPVAYLDSPITVAADSISSKRTYRLHLFKAPQTKVFLKETDGKQRERIKYTYSQPIRSLVVRGLNDSVQFSGSLFEYNATKDTITEWVEYSSANPRLRVVANDTVVDTIKLIRGAFGKDSLKASSKTIMVAKSATVQNLYAPFLIEFNRPITKIDTSLIVLLADTASPKYVPITFAFMDSVHRKLGISARWTEDNWYRMLLPKGAFTDFYGRTNDSTKYLFHTLTPDEYGTVMIGLQHMKPDVQYILTLTRDNGTDIATEYINNKDSLQLVYKHLEPGGYNIKIIIDRNKNGKWDTGEYPKKQPEKVYFHPSTIMVKANWEIKQEIDLKD